MRIITILAACLPVLGCILYVVRDDEKKDKDLFYENIEALADEEYSPEYPAGYYWSNKIDCSGWFTGDYQTCEENGPKNPCTDPGARTCDCGRNC